MERKLKIRLLNADEIECRVAMVNEKGISLLLYKDARVDQRILDETFGIFGWRRSHQCIGGNLYCTVEVYNKESGEWVAKQDVGTMAYTEKEKSQASDSFKRACFNWGIGRELYSAPFIWVPANKTTIQSRGDKFCCHDRFSVGSISYNNSREISALTIRNDKGHTVYELKEKGVSKDGPETRAKQEMRNANGIQDNKALSKSQIASLQAELDRTGVKMEDVQGRYRIQEPGAMNEETYHKVMRALSRTRSADVA